MFVEEQLQDEDIYLRVRHREQLPDHEDGRLFAGADHGADVDVVLVEMASGASRRATVDTAAHVWVIQEGQATFFLGSMQARIVRAGEVVRIPANVPWRLENTGAGTLRAVTMRLAASR